MPSAGPRERLDAIRDTLHGIAERGLKEEAEALREKHEAARFRRHPMEEITLHMTNGVGPVKGSEHGAAERTAAVMRAMGDVRIGAIATVQHDHKDEARKQYEELTRALQACPDTHAMLTGGDDTYTNVHDFMQVLRVQSCCSPHNAAWVALVEHAKWNRHAWLPAVDRLSMAPGDAFFAAQEAELKMLELEFAKLKERQEAARVVVDDCIDPVLATAANAGFHNYSGDSSRVAVAAAHDAIARNRSVAANLSRCMAEVTSARGGGRASGGAKTADAPRDVADELDARVRHELESIKKHYMDLIRGNTGVSNVRGGEHLQVIHEETTGVMQKATDARNKAISASLADDVRRGAIISMDINDRVRSLTEAVNAARLAGADERAYAATVRAINEVRTLPDVIAWQKQQQAHEALVKDAINAGVAIDAFHAFQRVLARVDADAQQRAGAIRGLLTPTTTELRFPVELWDTEEGKSVIATNAYESAHIPAGLMVDYDPPSGLTHAVDLCEDLLRDTLNKTTRETTTMLLENANRTQHVVPEPRHHAKLARALLRRPLTDSERRAMARITSEHLPVGASLREAITAGAHHVTASGA